MKKIIFTLALIAIAFESFSQPLSRLPETNLITANQTIPFVANPRRADGYGTWQISVSNLVNSLLTLPNFPIGSNAVALAPFLALSNQTATALSGKVAMDGGTATNLTIVEGLQFPDGAGIGKVLTSDGAGNITLEDPTGGSDNSKVSTNSGTAFNLKARPVDSDDTPLEIHSSAGQDTFLFRIFDSAGDPLFSVSEEGVLGGTTGNSVRLSSSSTSGYVWTATDTEGRGSWQAQTGGGDVSQAQLLASSNAAVSFSMTVSNAVASLELTRNSAVSNACIAFGMTVSNDVYGTTTTRLLAASNALVSFTMTASNTLYSTETTRNAAVSNALVTLLVGNDTITSNGAVALSIAASNNLYTAETIRNSNSVRVVAGTGGGSVDAAGSGGVATYTVNFPAGGTGSLTTVRTNSATAGTNLVSLLFTNQAIASPVQFHVGSNSVVATISASIQNLSGSGNVVASNGPTMNNVNLLGSTTGGSANFTDGSIGTLSTTDLTVEGPAIIEGGATIHGLLTVNSNLVFTPRPFVLGTTNWFADGSRGQIFTNSHTALGLTNYFATNIASGQTMTWEIFVGIGSTATLPQFIASDYTSGRIEGLASNCVNIVTIRRTPMGTNVSVRAKEFTLTATKRIGFFTNLATMTITAMATNDASTVAGVGGANTNFTFQAMGPAFVYTDAGTTNQNVVAIMGAGTGHENFVNIATNRTATPRTYSVSSVTNNWIAVGSLTLPQQVTNALYVAYTVRGTNVFYALRYIANPAP